MSGVRDLQIHKFIAPLLSQNTVVEVVQEKQMPMSKAQSQVPSLTASNAATYSASQDEAATVFCFLVPHEMIPEPKVKV
jgi:predicted patatin/cPLA2 family phospholipase